MSKYFDEIKFDTTPFDKVIEEAKEKKPKSKKEIKFKLNKAPFESNLIRIQQEIRKIATGSSDLTKRAIKQNAEMPVEAAIRRLEENPSKKNLDEFLRTARQDLGHYVSIAFTEWLATSFTEEK